MPKRIPTIYRILAAGVLIPMAVLVLLTVALRVWLPPARLRAIAEEQAGRHLHRQVRLKRVGLGAFRGVVVEGLEISERPDFAAGTFASFESLRLRVRLWPLLRKRVVVDDIILTAPYVRVVQLKPGEFNFSDLLPTESPAASAAEERPAARPAAGVALSLSAGELALREGRLDYEDRVSGAAWRLERAKAVMQAVSLSHPFPLEAGFAARQLRPGALRVQAGLKARADFTGLFANRVALDIERLSADAGGMSLVLAGPLRLESDRIEAPELSGKLDGAALSLKLSLAGLNKTPDARLYAKLAALDAAKILELKTAYLGEPVGSGRAPGAAAAAPVAEPARAVPVNTSGSAAIGRVVYGGFKAQDFSLSWDLKSLTPDMRGLSGRAELSVGAGSFSPEAGVQSRSKLFSALLLPLKLLKQIGTLGGRSQVIPSFDIVAFDSIKGRYAVERGLVTVTDFRMAGPQADVRAGGRVDLPPQRLDLKISLAVAKIPPVQVDVKGTFDKPEPRLRLDKAVAEPLQKLAAPLLKNLFKK